jgi:hypothetical protein
MSRTRLVVASLATLVLAACTAPTEPRTSRLAAPATAAADSTLTCKSGFSVVNGRCQ